MADQFLRTKQIYGGRLVEALARCHVAVFGVGGVGGYAVEALARSGVGRFTLVDGDRISLSNLNRQIIATHDTLGMLKTEAFAARVASISPACRVTECPLFFLPGDSASDAMDFSVFDYVIDAVDTVKAKVEIIRRAKAVGVPVISAMGAGNKKDPMGFRVCDIAKTDTDPLAKAVRLLLRKQGISGVKVVFSRELPCGTADDVIPDLKREGGSAAPGSSAFVPAAAGLLLAKTVLEDLLEIQASRLSF